MANRVDACGFLPRVATVRYGRVVRADFSLGGRRRQNTSCASHTVPRDVRASRLYPVVVLDDGGCVEMELGARPASVLRHCRRRRTAEYSPTAATWSWARRR